MYRPVIMQSFRCIVVCFISAFLLQTPVCAGAPTFNDNATDPSGTPYIINYSPKVYRGGTQNFAVVQDQAGLMYFGNNWGILVFDGVSWGLMRTPTRSLVRSLCLVEDKIYAGSVGDLGYLETDITGKTSFISLLDSIPGEDRNFKDVYDIHYYGDDIYFRTRYSLFRYNNGKFRTWKTEEEFGSSFVVLDNFL
jgi:hypothetical protein